MMEPFGGVERAMDEDVARGGAVSEFDVLTGPGEADGVLTDDVAAADGEDLI